MDFSCSIARGIFPDQGLNLCLLHWQVDSLSLSPTREALYIFFLSLPPSLAISIFKREREKFLINNQFSGFSWKFGSWTHGEGDSLPDAAWLSQPQALPPGSPSCDSYL